MLATVLQALYLPTQALLFIFCRPDTKEQWSGVRQPMAWCIEVAGLNSELCPLPPIMPTEGRSFPAESMSTALGSGAGSKGDTESPATEWSSRSSLAKDLH